MRKVKQIAKQSGRQSVGSQGRIRTYGQAVLAQPATHLGDTVAGDEEAAPEPATPGHVATGSHSRS